jgi:hypothetical protein
MFILQRRTDLIGSDVAKGMELRGSGSASRSWDSLRTVLTCVCVYK